jgi:prevent-host-death family protein
LLDMRDVGIRELKAQLSRVVREVEEGETVIVTDRGRPIAEIRPVTVAPPAEEHPGLLKMAREGRLVLPQVRNHPGLYARPRRPLGRLHPTVAELLDAGREDR